MLWASGSRCDVRVKGSPRSRHQSTQALWQGKMVVTTRSPAPWAHLVEEHVPEKGPSRQGKNHDPYRDTFFSLFELRRSNRRSKGRGNPRAKTAERNKTGKQKWSANSLNLQYLSLKMLSFVSRSGSPFLKLRRVYLCVRLRCRPQLYGLSDHGWKNHSVP